MNEYNPRDDFNRSLNDCYSEVKKRMANGGPGWDGNAQNAMQAAAASAASLPSGSGNRIVDEREKTHGNFREVAGTACALKAVIYESMPDLSNVQDEALSMICTKIARIVCGDPNYDDHWADIAGYAELARKAK